MDFLIFQVPILMVQASLDGILLGILFALIAYGMALQWGVMNIINIAQGDLVILGGYITYFMYLSGIHPALGVIVAPAIMYFVGVGLYKLVINKVVDRDLFYLHTCYIWHKYSFYAVNEFCIWCRRCSCKLRIWYNNVI
jgi:branched-chain amino acid transport system permease protein